MAEPPQELRLFALSGRPTEVKVGEQLLSVTAYTATGPVDRVTYGNGDYVQNRYDAFNRLLGGCYADGGDAYTYDYGANGQVAQVKNHELRTVATSECDVAGRPMRITTFTSTFSANDTQILIHRRPRQPANPRQF